MTYLRERLDSILRQTFADWEIIVIDGESNDGTWELLSEIARDEPRMRLERARPEGIYPAFNRCVERAEGELIYIATSDDTMAEDCLEKMVRALDHNPDCDLAHCPMKVIGVDGCETQDWWSGNSLFAKSSGDWLQQPHKRIAPHDGVLCLLGDNVYSSVTQLLIRRSLFDRIGFYPTQWGSVGDFHWNLRAGLTASAVHVPDTWASWRMHDEQATAGAALGSLEHEVKIDGMIDDVLQWVRTTPGLLPDSVESKAEALKLFLRKFSSFQRPGDRRRYVITSALKGFPPAWSYLRSLVIRGERWPKAAPRAIRKWMRNSIKACA
jgi:hypothetical protein